MKDYMDYPLPVETHPVYGPVFCHVAENRPTCYINTDVHMGTRDKTMSKFLFEKGVPFTLRKGFALSSKGTEHLILNINPWSSDFRKPLIHVIRADCFTELAIPLPGGKLAYAIGFAAQFVRGSDTRFRLESSAGSELLRVFDSVEEFIAQNCLTKLHRSGITSNPDFVEFIRESLCK